MSDSRSNPVVLYGVRGRADQFVGVPEVLQKRGVWTQYERLWGEEIAWGGHVHPQVIRRAGAVVCADLTHNGHVRAVRVARKYGVPSVLLVDGVVEWSNVMLNRWLGKRYLRPAPEDVVLCSGALHADILAAMGNSVVVTGLPRLAGFAEQVEQLRALRGSSNAPKQRRILITTANFPAGNERAKHRILVCLGALRDAMLAADVHPVWRVTGGLCEALGVQPDTQALAESLADADALITTASTVAIEGMLSGIPTGVLHPHPWPLWVPGVWEWKPGVQIDQVELQSVRMKLDESRSICKAAEGSINRLRGGTLAVEPESDAGLERQAGAFIEMLLDPSSEQISLQNRLRDGMHQDNGPAAVADSIEQAAKHVGCTRSEHTDQKKPIEPIEPIGPTRIQVPRDAGTPRLMKNIVSLIVSREWPAHAVSAWSARMSRIYEESPDLGYRFHTVHVATDPSDYEESGVLYDPQAPNQHIVTLEPSDDTATRMRRVVDAVGMLEPDIVIPNEGDLAFNVCACLRGRGARSLVVLHHDAWSMREELCTYSRWDALVIAGDDDGTQEEWVAEFAGANPMRIPYGVPVVSERVRHADDVPIELAYIGTIAQGRRRVFDLLGVLGELDRQGVRYRFHLVGDGPDLESWIERSRLGGISERVTIHGRLAANAVERLLCSIDLCLLVSESEGAGMTMVEAMGAGVVPCVTDTGGGVSRIIQDGVDGIVVPVGACNEMASRIAGLAAAPGSIDNMSDAARSCIRTRDLDTQTMARRYARVFDGVLNSKPRTMPSDDCARLSPSKIIRHADSEDESDAWIRNNLALAGYRAVSEGGFAEGCDSVLVRASDPRPSQRQVEEWRGRGLGVAVSPNMCLDRREYGAEQAVASLLERGHMRIAICAAPGQTNRVARIAQNEVRIVGFIDPLAQQGDTHLGLPAAHPEIADTILSPDAIMLMGGIAEPLLYEMCRPVGNQVLREFVDMSAAEASISLSGINDLAHDVRDGRHVVLLTDTGASVLIEQRIGCTTISIEISDCTAPVDMPSTMGTDCVLGVAMLELTDQVNTAARKWHAAGGIVRSFPGKIEIMGDVAR